jgi:hypothetical protein
VSLARSIRPTAPIANSVLLVANYGKLPLAFEANQGQTDQQVRFLSRGAGFSLFLTSTEAVLALQPSDISDQPSGEPSFRSQVSGVRKDKSPRAIVCMKLMGANAKAEVIGEDELAGKSSYFIGNDPKNWHTNVQQFAKVRYENVYPGVDLVYYGRQRELEYDFVLRPGADPQAIRLGIDGAKKIRMEQGDLVLTSAAGDVRLRSPKIYQNLKGIRQEVRGRYVITGKNEVGFRVASYNRTKLLIIDPILSYSTYLGGSLNDVGLGIAVDSAGNAYVTGNTQSTDFPTANSIQPTNHGGYDVFVTKINADGSALVYSTYLGGSGDDYGTTIAVDASGNAYVTGYTTSTNFPEAKAIQSENHGGTDAFVTKISGTGSALVYSTYLGGSLNDVGLGIAVDSAGNAYVTGNTQSTDFPTANAFQPTNHGGSSFDGTASGDAFVSKINPSGTVLVYSTYLGGTGEDYGRGIAVDSAGSAYVTGFTGSTDFPIANAIQPMSHGGQYYRRDAFVTKLNAAGSALVYSTYLGGSWDEYGNRIAVDPTGNAYVTGQTPSLDFPTANAIQPTSHGSWEAFVTKINADGNAFVYSTFLGGSGTDGGEGIAADAAGNAYIGGHTDSADFPIANAIQSGNYGKLDAFVTKVNADGSAFVYSTYLGGSGDDQGYDIAVDSADSAYVTGYSVSNNFPATPLAFQPLRKVIKKSSTTSDTFVAKIASQTFVSVSPLKLTFLTQVIGTTSVAKKLTFTNNGTGTLTINKIYFAGLNAGDFSETNTCGDALAAGASCTVSVTFMPTAKNTRKAVLAISDSDPASPQAVSLRGSGSAVLLSGNKLSFGGQPVGTSSAPQNVKLTNVGSTQLNFTGITITGTNAGDFLQTNTCGTSIAAGATCTITATFKPTAQGTRKGTVSISDDGGGSQQRVALSGTGT